MKVKIFCGISGSGKSTYIKNHYPDADVISADHYFMKDGEYKFNPSDLPKAHGACLREFVYQVSLMPQGNRAVVVVDNTNTTLTEIAPYAALALAYGHDLEVIIIEAPVDKAFLRNAHNVPRSNVEGQNERLKELKLPPWWPVTKVSAVFDYPPKVTPTTCTYDPKEAKGAPLGMYHCPVCGQMVLAGAEHPGTLE